MQLFLFLVAPICATIAVRAIEADPAVFANTTFDFIVVGGGTTGLGVATRLSDDFSAIVGVIEAGKHLADNTILIPALGGSGVGNPTYDWLLSTTPQAQLGNRTFLLGRGKVLGGTSAMNLMQYTKASKREYDDWGQLGNPGWNFDDLQGFMKKAESWTPPEPRTVSQFATDNHAPDHGRNGSIQTTANANYSGLIPEYLDSLEKLSGLPRNLSPLGGNPVGSMSVTVTVDAHNRSRSYSANGYYDPRSSRSNLVVLTGAEVIKVETEKGTSGLHKATKVHYIAQNNVTYGASVSREVIISAGSVKTPQVLELSGIGDSRHLRSVGISTVIDLPGVGKNLQDHVGVSLSFSTLPNITTYDALRDPDILPILFQQYETNRTGLLSGPPSTTAFLPLERFVSAGDIMRIKRDLDKDLSKAQFKTQAYHIQRQWLDDNTVPQLELAFLAGGIGANITDPKAKFYSFDVVCLHPFARGAVNVANDDGRSAPVIDPRFLDSPGDFDRQILLHGLRFALNMAQTEPLRNLTTSVFSGPPFNATDQELEEWIRDNATSDLHPTGSASMLPRDLGGVVGPDFLVHGTNNIRVVDMSIWPLQLGTHPTATLYGLAEKAADVIRQRNINLNED